MKENRALVTYLRVYTLDRAVPRESAETRRCLFKVASDEKLFLAPRYGITRALMDARSKGLGIKPDTQSGSLAESDELHIGESNNRQGLQIRWINQTRDRNPRIRLIPAELTTR